jgi:hypothetical protein
MSYLAIIRENEKRDKIKRAFSLVLVLIGVHHMNSNSSIYKPKWYRSNWKLSAFCYHEALPHKHAPPLGALFILRFPFIERNQKARRVCDWRYMLMSPLASKS